MPLDKPLDLNFEQGELNASISNSISRDTSCDDISSQMAVYRGQYMEVLLENNRLAGKIKELEFTIQDLREKLKSDQD